MVNFNYSVFEIYFGSIQLCLQIKTLGNLSFAFEAFVNSKWKLDNTLLYVGFENYLLQGKIVFTILKF